MAELNLASNLSGICMSEQLTKVFVYTLAAAVAVYLFLKPDGKR
jgi:hypothetical protein